MNKDLERLTNELDYFILLFFVQYVKVNCNYLSGAAQAEQTHTTHKENIIVLKLKMIK